MLKTLRIPYRINLLSKISEAIKETINEMLFGLQATAAQHSAMIDLVVHSHKVLLDMDFALQSYISDASAIPCVDFVAIIFIPLEHFLHKFQNLYKIVTSLVTN